MVAGKVDNNIAPWMAGIVWISYRLLERDMEMACDEAVLEKLGAHEKKNYCESLLNLADSKNYFVGNPVAFGESDVKVRIKNVLNYKKPRFWISLVAVTILVITALNCLNGPKEGNSHEEDIYVEMTEVTYPLTKETVEPIFAQVDLPGMVTEEEYDSAIRTSIDIRDEENRLSLGIASSADSDKRFLGITLIPYLHSGAATAYLPEEKCLQYMEEQGYYTLADECANQDGAQIRFVNAVLTNADDVNGDKDVASYRFVATLAKIKDDETKEFTIDGEICVVNMLNGWKVDEFYMNGTDTLMNAVMSESSYELANEQVQPQPTENHQDITEEEMFEIFQTEYGWTDLANQQLFWDEASGRVVINYYFDALADGWQMDSAREYGLNTFVLKRQNSLGGPHAYQNWAYSQEIKEVVIQVFCNGNMNFQDIYGGIEDRIVHTESHYEK